MDSYPLAPLPVHIVEFMHQQNFDSLLYYIVIFVPSLAFIPQYYKIYSTRQLGNFSYYICWILLTCNALRICYWYGNHFDDGRIALQSALMILVQYAFSRLIKSVLQEEVLIIDDGNFSNDDLNNFLKYGAISKFTIILMSILTVLNLNIHFGDQSDDISPFSRKFIELTGIISLSIESMLPVPQFYSNYKEGRVEGLSLSLILSWLIGDGLKAFFYISQSYPIYFILCSIFQLIVDFGIIIQFATSSRPHYR